MKQLIKVFSILAVVGALGVFLTIDVEAGIVGTPHDLTSASGGGNYSTTSTDQVCVFCHTPHKADVAQTAPLWNRQMPTGPFTMYSSTTIDMLQAASPEGVSLACLSCHDGSVAFDVLINGPGSGGFTAGGADLGMDFSGGTVAFDSMQTTSAANIGPNLSQEHPISISYDEGLDTAFNPVAGLTLPLYTGTNPNQVECGTCHNAHDNSNTMFLRMSNAASALCVHCHIK